MLNPPRLQTSKQVMCINKYPSHHDPHERITHIGGIHLGTLWRRSQEQAIAEIEAEPRSYWTTDRLGHEVWVVIGVHNGRKYLRTENDDSSQNNLLSLRDCT